MAQMDHLSSLFTERLMCAARDMFEAVKYEVSEYQVEIERLKQENLHLRIVLREVNACTSKERLSPDGAPLDQDSNQRPPNSDPSVLQLKLKGAVVVQQEVPLDVVLSRNSSSAPDTRTSQANSQELPNLSLLDSNPSVKVELSPVHQDAEPQELLGYPPSSQSTLTSCSKEPLHFSGQPAKEEELTSGLLDTDTDIKNEPLDSQVNCLDNANTVAPRENITKKRLQDLRNNQSGRPSSVLLPSEIRRCKQRKQHQKCSRKSYRCDHCGNNYSHKQGLENHRRIHTGERPFECRFCGRCFKQRAHLKEHERIHTGERPFICSVCGRRFVQSTQLKRHFRSRHLAK